MNEENEAAIIIVADTQDIPIDPNDDVGDVMVKLLNQNEELRTSNESLTEENAQLQKKLSVAEEESKLTKDELQSNEESLSSEIELLKAERDEFQKKYYQAVAEKNRLEKTLQKENIVVVDVGIPTDGVALASLNVFNEKSSSWNINSGGKEDTLGYDYSSTNSYIVLGNGHWYDNGYAEYFIDGKYTKLTGNIAPHSSAAGEDTSTVQIYGDNGMLLYESKTVSVRTDVFSFELDASKMTGVRFLRIVQSGSADIPLLLTDWTLS